MSFLFIICYGFFTTYLNKRHHLRYIIMQNQFWLSWLICSGQVWCLLGRHDTCDLSCVYVFSGHACVYSVPWSETIITFFLMTSSFQMQCNGTNSLWKYWCFSYAFYFRLWIFQRHSVTLCTQEGKLKHFSLWAKWKVLYCKLTLAHSCHIKWLLVYTNSRNVPRVAWGQREERCVPDKK